MISESIKTPEALTHEKNIQYGEKPWSWSKAPLALFPSHMVLAVAWLLYVNTYSALAESLCSGKKVHNQQSYVLSGISLFSLPSWILDKSKTHFMEEINSW